ncbi:antigen p97 [Branchiostoma belcheri]|nr:antigen p97 [Branchiostoma belcheri]
MRVPVFLALLCWVACASAWECDENAEHLTAVDIKIKSHEDHVIYGQLHACPRAGEELSQNLRFRFQNPRNIILDQETGSFQYSPDREHFSGVDNFVYTVEDEVERSEPASVFISLRPQPDEPRLQVQHVQGNEGEVIPLHIQAELEDQDGSETLTVTLCNCGQEVSCKSDKCRCQLSVPSGWHFLAGGQRVHRRNLNKLTQDQANQLSVRVPENSHGQYCFGVHAITVEQKGKGHVHAQVSQDMHITVHSRNLPPTITHHSRTETLRWCTISSQEQQKCQEMSRAFSRRLNHRLECVQGQSSEDCMYKISNNMADVITLDGGDIYTAGSQYNLVPVMGEDYGNGDASYWAVAVVRKDNPEINMNNLRGRKSCHTGIGKTSGWNVPVGWLIQNNQIQVDNRRSIPQTVGSFFSKSCVPGAQSPEYNPDGTNPESLCSLCVGEGENRCVRNTNEPYYGYSGAFRCLVEGAGEVAFVNHVTVSENTNGHSEEEWTRNLDEDDFELLCPDGSRRPWNQYKECNLARVPSHAVMTSPRSRTDIQQIVNFLQLCQDHFGFQSYGDFEMFDSSVFGGRDLLFRDNVQRLVPVGQRNTWQKWLGSGYMESVGHLISHDQERNQRVLEKQVRWCVTSDAEMEKCQVLSRVQKQGVAFPTVQCVQADNADQCMQMIHMNQADVITLDGGDIYQAGMKYNMRPIMGEDYGNGDASYWAVAVVRKDDPEINMNNLRGRKSCHTGLGKTAGWIIPTGWLVDQAFVQTDGQTSLVQAVGHFFSKSCVPGAQSPEYNPDGTNPESLCSCVSGREKTAVCLVEGAGEVAFVNHQTIFENTNGRSEEAWTRNLHQNDFELLCPDGSRKQWNQYKECNLARVPSHAVMTSPRSRTDIQQIVNILTQAQEHFGQHSDFQMFDSSKFGGRDLMFRDNVQRLVPVGQRNTWQKWLGSSYLTSIRSMIHRDEQRTQRVLDKQVRWCVTSEAEKQKCERMSSSLDSYDFVTFPTVKCVQADNADQCMQMIHMNQADVITLDGGDIYQAGMKYNMRPIMGEDYGNGDTSYWAVAVVRKDNPEINMNNLRGRKSCHTGLGKTAGWIIPTGWLVDQDFVQTDGQTSLVQAVGHFFSKSCVPGAKSPEYDPQNTNPSTLCSLCAGAGEDHCVRNKNEPYYGYSGAFRCLAEGAGDVAFINHQTVQDNTDGHNPENWAAGLRADDFELLCTDGSRRPVDQWRECSLARVPSHAVMTSNDRSQEWVNRVVRLLKGVQEQFGSDENENDFQLFDSSSFGGHDLLFRDDTQHLVEVGSKDSWEKWLGQEYLRCIRSHHSDTHSSSGQQPALSTSEGRPVLLSNLRIQDAEGHNGRYHVHATVNQGGHLWVRDGLDSIVFTSDAKSKTTNQHDTRHHRHQDSHQRSEESELSREDSSSQEHPRRHPRSHESRSHESHSQERNHQDSNPLSHLWDGLWHMWDSSDERQHSSEERQHRHSSEESHRDMAWHDVHTSMEKERQELTMDDDFYQHYKHHHFQYSKNGRPSLSFSGDLAAVQKALSSLVFVPWCQQWPTPPNWDLPPTTWMFPSEEDQTLSEDPNHPAIWPAWYPRFWYPFPTKSWTWWPRVLPPYWLNQQCQDWTSMIHISVSEEAPSSCASRQDRRDRPVTDMDIPVHVQSRTSGPISLIPKNLFYYFDSEAESVPINDIHIRSQLTDVNLHLKFNVIEDHLATVQAESVEAPEFTCRSVEECNEHLRTVKVHFRNGVRATDICHLGIQISMFKDNSDIPSDLLTVWAYQTSGQCVDPWATNSNFHLSNERSHTNQGQTVDINLIPEDLSNEESLNGILHVTIRAPHGLVTYTAPDGLRTFEDHMGVRQRIPTNLCLSGPAEMVKQALQTVRYTPIRAFTGTDSITIEYGTTRTAMRLSPDKIHPRMTVVHKVEVKPVPSPILVQAPSHMCVNQQQRPLPHIDSNLELQSMWHKPAPNMVKLTVTATSGDVNINQHKLQQEFHPSESSQEHHQDMVHLDINVEHRQRPSGSWLQVVAEDWVVRHILHNQLVWYKPNKCVSSQQPTQHDTIHVEVEEVKSEHVEEVSSKHVTSSEIQSLVEEVKSEHVTSSEIQVTVDCHQPQQQRWQVDGVSSSEQQSREVCTSLYYDSHPRFSTKDRPSSPEKETSHSVSVSSEWSLELSPWSVEQTSTEVEVTSDSECTPTESWNDWSECDADSCQMGSQWRERRTRNTNPASNRYCQPQRETRQCTNCGQSVKLKLYTLVHIKN